MSLRSALLALAILTVGVGAQAATVSIGSPVSGPSNTVDVPLTIATGVGETLSGFELTIEYVNACWASISVLPGAALLARTSDVMNSNSNTNVSGVIPGTDRSLKIIGVIFNPAECLPGSATSEVAIMRFTPVAAPPPGCGVLGWNAAVVLGDPETAVTTCAGNEIALTAGNCNPAPPGTVPFCFVAGKVGYFSNFAAKPVPSTQVDDSTPPPSTTSDAAGNYILVSAPGSSPTPVGASRSEFAVDNKVINAADWLACLKHINFIAPLGTDAQVACDVNSSGGATPVTIADCTLIIDELLLFPAPNPTRSWAFDVDPPLPPTNPGSSVCPAVGKDIWAYLKGDCNGSWPNSNPKPTGPSRIPVFLDVADFSASEVTLALKADVGMEPLETLLFTLEYDASQLEYLGLVPGSQAKEFAVRDNPTESGLLRAAAAGWKGPAEVSGEMLQLRFRVLDSRSSVVKVVEMEVNDLPAVNLPVVEVTTNPNTVSAVPAQYFLSGYPNPFNPSITVEFGVPQSAGPVLGTVRVLDVAGRQVRTLQAGNLTPGFHNVVWNGLDESGNQVQSGIYFVQATLGSWKQVHKVTLLK